MIQVDVINNGAMPVISRPVNIDGSSQPGNAGVCQNDITIRSNYGIVLQDDSTDIGLQLVNGSDDSVIKGLNIRNFFNNVAIIDSDDNHIQCNFIGTNESGTAGSDSNAANGIIIGCDSSENIIGGTLPEDGNLIANQDSDGIQFFAGFDCAPSFNLSKNNAVLSNFIGT